MDVMGTHNPALSEDIAYVILGTLPSKKVDVVEGLPTEIALVIFGQLSAEDLWSCLAVNNRWRELANTQTLWAKHLEEFDIGPDDTEDILQDGGGSPSFQLCLNCQRWKQVQITLVNWKHWKFKKYPFPSVFREPLVVSSGNTIATLDTSMKIKIFTIRNDAIQQTSQFLSPFSKLRAVTEDIGTLLLNKEYLIYKIFNILVIYKKGSSCSLQSVFLINKLGDATFLNKDYLDSLSKHIVDHISSDFTYLVEDKLWISFSAGDKEFHYLLNLQSNGISRIIPPVDGIVYYCEGTKTRMILEYETKIAVYDYNGTFQYVKEFHQNYLSLASNGKVLAVFTSPTIYINDLLTGTDISSIENNWFMPLHLYLHPVKNVVYLTTTIVKAFEIFAYQINNGIKSLLWRTIIKMVNSTGRLGSKFHFIYGIYLVVFIEEYLTCTKYLAVNFVYFIDTRTGDIVNMGKFCGLLEFNQRFFIKGNSTLMVCSAS